MVTVAEPLLDAVREAIVGQGFVAVRVQAADPPGDRLQCVAAGMQTVAGPGQVLVHDLEWPMVSTVVVERILTSIRAGAVAVMPARPVTDSIKAVDDTGVLAATLDRSALRVVQYPRGFDAEVLALLVNRSQTSMFDELEAALATGTHVTLVEGGDEAFRVELPRDTGYLVAFIESRQDLSGQ